MCHGLRFRDLYNRQSVRKVTSFGKIILTAIEAIEMLENQGNLKHIINIIKTLNFRENAE